MHLSHRALAKSIVLAVTLLTPFLLSSVRAQDKQSKGPGKKSSPPAGSSQKPIGETAKPGGEPAKPTAKATADGGKKTSEHIIYVPYSKLSEVFEKEAQNVLLPFAEYRRLWDAVQKMGAGPGKPPVSAVISQITYVATVKEDTALLQAKLAVDSLVDDWVRLPIAFTDAAVSKVEGGTLAAAGPGQYMLLIKEKGRHEITIHLATQVVKTPDGKKIVVRGPLAGSTSLDLSIPEGDLDVELIPKLAGVQIDRQTESTRVRTTLGPTDSLSVAWRGKSKTAISQPIAIANNQMRVTVGDGVVRTQAKIEYQLLRGELSQFELTLPAAEKLLDIQAPGLRDWSTKQEGSVQKVTARLHSAVNGKLAVTVEAERPVPAGAFEVGNIRAANIQRETGVIGLFAGEDLSLSISDRKEVARVSMNEAPQEMHRAGGLYFKFYSSDYRLAVEASAIAAKVLANSYFTYRLEEGRLRIEARFRFDVQRSGLFTSRIRLPAGIELEDVQSAVLERYEQSAQKDRTTLVIHLRERISGPFEVAINASMARPDPNAPLDLPVLEPLDATSEQGAIVLLAHESFEVTSDPAKTKGVRPASANELSQLGLGIPNEPRMILSATYRYLTRPISVGFVVKKRNTRIVADVFSKIHVRENAVLTETTILYDVQYAGADVLELAVPEAVADRVEITGPNIKEKHRGQAKDGLTPWKVVLHTRTLGKQIITVKFEEPISLAKTGSAKVDATIKLARPLGVERETAQIAVSKERALAIEDEPKDVEPIDPRRLAIPPELQAAANKDLGEVQLAYQYYRHPATVKLSITKHEIQRMIQTVVRYTLIDVVVSDQGPTTYQANFLVQSSERQRLGLSLPAGTRILGVSVAGKSVQPEKDAKSQGNAYLVNVSRATAVDQSFPVSIVYEQPAASGVKGLEVQTLLPNSLPSVSFEMPTFTGDATVQRVFWRISLPKRYTMVGNPASYQNETNPISALYQGVGFASEAPSELLSWLGDWRNSATQSVFEFPTVGRSFVFSGLGGVPVIRLNYGFVPSMMVSMSSIALVIMLLTLRLSHEKKVTLVIFFSALLIGIGLFAPDAVCRWLTAAEIGLGIGSVAWLANSILLEQRRLIAEKAALRALAIAQLANQPPPKPLEPAAASTNPGGASNAT